MCVCVSVYFNVCICLCESLKVLMYSLYVNMTFVYLHSFL